MGNLHNYSGIEIVVVNMDIGGVLLWKRRKDMEMSEFNSNSFKIWNKIPGIKFGGNDGSVENLAKS